MIGKIRVLISHNDEEIKNRIVNILEKIDDVEIIATSESLDSAFNKIIEFKPEMVFVKYDFGTDIKGLDLVKKLKKILQDDIPIFNFITTNMPKEDFLEIRKLIGDKMNTIIKENTPIRYTGIINDYKEYIKANS